jgi:hypothetical protein
MSNGPPPRSQPKTEKQLGRLVSNYAEASGLGVRRVRQRVSAMAFLKWVSLREDTLLPLVEQFFKERVWGPLRLEKLARQLNSHDQANAEAGKLRTIQLRRLIADADRNLAAQVRAIEAGVDIEVVKARIEELKADKQAAQVALDAIPPAERETEDNYLLERLARIPDLTQQLRDATPEIKRLAFQAFELRVEFDKAQRHIALSATITEAVARALENTRTPPLEGPHA